MEDIMNGC
jgi:hypothetical protein